MAMQAMRVQAIQAIEALREVYVPHLQSELEVAIKDLSMLVDGLEVTASGSEQAIRTLPQAPVDVERDARTFALVVGALFLINLGSRIIVAPLVRATFTNMKHQQVAKFAQSLQQAMCCGALTCIGFLVVSTQEWVWPSKRWWAGFATGGHEMIRSDTRLYYLACLAWHVQAAIWLLLGLRPKHFWEALLQHVVTGVLITVSYVWGWNRVGVVVMVLLSPAEVPLHLAKLCQCAADAAELYIWQFAADRFFDIFACIFLVTRLAMYSYVCWSVREEGQHHVPEAVAPAGWVCLGLLLVLLLLQCRWLALIIAKIGRRSQHGSKGAEDSLADDDGEREVAEAEVDLAVLSKAAAPEGGRGRKEEQATCPEWRRLMKDSSKLQLLSSSEPPKRPLTPYFLYLRDHRKEISQQLPEGTKNPAVEVAKIAGAQWRALDESTKLRYSQEYKELKEEYDRAKAKHEACVAVVAMAAVK